MTSVDQVLALAERGFHVFPIRENSKKPAITDFPTRATRDPELIRKWWQDGRRNVGISTSRFGENEALVVVDVDVKDGRHGDETLLALDLEGKELPLTLEHTTPSGGRHLLYVCDEACNQHGSDTLGSGLDVRSRGGYIVAPGSVVDGKSYEQANGHTQLARAPGWLVTALGLDRRDRIGSDDRMVGVSSAWAADRAVDYLKALPGAIVGTRGSTAYKIAARLKELGCSVDEALFLMDLHWAYRCEPPMPDADLEESVVHAYKYSQMPQGSVSPEAAFAQKPPEDLPSKPEKLNPFAEINREFAFVKNGAFILQETTDDEGNFVVERLSVSDIHAWFANKPWASGKEKPRPISMAWMEWPGRRQYDSVVFAPGQQVDPRWYNLWRGFSVKPKAGQHQAVEAFKEHVFKNACNGDPKLFHWLMGYFAHMIQRPWEKPLVALVFRGRKGVGKNAIIERVGALLGTHFLVVDDDRYLLGNFNSHLESNLCFVLDEAAWAGDKRAEGKLKGLITGGKRLIEYKGLEPRNRRNLSRIVVLGNEDWLVPASVDERRFAVFHIGEGRKGDRKFFQTMREDMEQGGYAHLLHYLQTYDLSGVDVNLAPDTEALTDQKHAGLELTQQWWLDCIYTGQIQGGDWGGVWPEISHTNRLRDALFRWTRNRNIRTRLLDEVAFGRVLREVAPSFKRKKIRPELTDDTTYGYWFPGLESLRKDWENYIGSAVKWPEEN